MIKPSACPNNRDRFTVSLGQASLDGMRLAVSHFNANRRQGEVEIDLVIEDDRAQPATSASALQQMLAVHKLRLILGPLTSGCTIAVAPVAESNHVVILSPGASAPSISAAGDQDGTEYKHPEPSAAIAT